MSDDPMHGATRSAEAAQPLLMPGDMRVAQAAKRWLTVATDASSPDTQLFARLIAERDARNELSLLGFTPREWRALMQRHFVPAKVSVLTPAVALIPSEHADFVHSLHTLLLEHASAIVEAEDAYALATIIAHACLRPDHLWRDLGLAGRDEVTWMLTRYFPTLVALNVANLRWKKFLAQQRALSLGLEPGPAPGCPGCEDYAHCFPVSE
jgi:nitrogen fixation protein NifQ